ncbi:FGGY carbohydrate kinase domain-containing protein [Stomoxys calcitrans]|uniref:FGGY carbohydrate kinase domain-containing protein n=1 Tax=Stomoxys calcitrans TaxID=35570 RepID=UPI0027E35493|nr:FGGY carbohydrate kinase domain-containing protein [Stomoxys calcitrans]XP_059218648.1 FGGY carbohydrate kinase domain-containing protein [Stomoxys calcitrans]
MPKIYFVGVDVGTSSARAALITSDGKVLKQATRNIRIWNPEHEYFEQSSDDIWQAVCYCVKDVTSDVPKEEIVAISFDATCSLVILGENGESLSVSKNREAEQNIILWMDHRAHEETAHINATKHDLLKYVGGQVSLEMELPKLLWLKNNCFMSTWTKIWRAFDLPDFLTWRSTGCDSRSLCSVVCKWNYDAEKMQWNREFFREIGLEELLENNAEIIGSCIQEPGTPVGSGLTEKAASEMSLLPGTIVGTSLIDAHAGALGMFGCISMEYKCELEGKIAMICGTSTCHMSLTREPCWAQGVWGPYRSAIIPGYYLNEGGQSAAGLLLDYVIKCHPQYMHIKMKLGDTEHIYSYLNRRVKEIAKEKGLDDACYLTKDIHVWPDFHGNRSPIADPSLKGMISGVNMNVDEEALAILYLAFVQSLAYGTRHIIENLVKHQRVPVQTLLFCGGLSKNALYVQNHADICQLPALIPDEQEMVLVGAAMLGACAAKVYENLEVASSAMGGNGKMLKPHFSTKDYHERKYQVFLEMLNDQRKYKDIMM